MSISTHVIGFKPPDDKWKKMKASYDACKAAEVDPPDVVNEFFNWVPPDDSGVEVELKKNALSVYNVGSCSGFEVEIDKLPKDIKIIRFYNSF